MKNLFLIFALMFSLYSTNTLAQDGNVAINNDGSTPDDSAILDVKSTTKGLLVPRMTSSQRKAISNPSGGLMVYDLDKFTLYLYDGMSWLPLAFVPKNELYPSPRFGNDTAVGDKLGESVAIDGDYAIVGARLAEGTTSNQGAAYIFHKDGNSWTQQAKLSVPNTTFFGKSVTIAGDYAIVGAKYTSSQEGVAFVFKRDGANWTQQTAISVFQASPDFAGVLDMESNQVIIGGTDPVYVYARTGETWTQNGVLTDVDASANFGNSVAIDGDYALIGDPTQTINVNPAEGAAYVFVKDGGTWIQQAKLTADDGNNFYNFGASVSIFNTYIFIGATGATGATQETQNDDRGAVYLFERSGNTWFEETKFSDEITSDVRNFGESVKVDGEYLVIGAPDNNNSKGMAYIYKLTDNAPFQDTWNYVRMVEEYEGVSQNSFGNAIDMSQLTIIIGSFENSQLGEEAGSFSLLNIE